MTRRRLALLPPALTLAAALTLTGCTDDAPADDATSAAPSASPTASAEPAAPTGSADPDASATPGDADDADDATDDASAAPSPEASDGAAAVDPTTGALAAIALAAAEAGGTPYAIDTEAGNWRVDVAVDGATVEVTVDPTGTEALGTRDDDLGADERTALGEATVQLPEAVQRVVSDTGGTLREADLDADAPVRWNVSVTVEGAEQEHHVDAATGEITRDAD